LAILLPQLLDEVCPHRILHFAPEPVLRACFENRDLVYETADLHLEDATHSGVDLQHLPFADGSYDMLLCNHVLEHVPDDELAITELARVLSSSGVAVLTVPGDFTRSETRHFEGILPNGHYRDYGRDLIQRLKLSFAHVSAIDMHGLSRDGLMSGVRRGDTAFVCRHAALI
jgi:SAM-dependent methyltransferase